ncbi:MAG: L-threonylcarbamoyladenylate synthase [Spirochaetales bacterium]|nr:L-threonylcarbamoyladenylate synthase [Spirochaetales bacterium]
MAAIINLDDIEEVASRLKRGEVGVIPSDTIYGISAIVSESAMERIYEIKERPQSKKLIVLSNKESLSSLGVIVSDDILSLWPSPLTVILPTRDGDTLAVRVPEDKYLSSLIALTGPLFSTSVNISGKPSLQSFSEILPAFSDKVDFIVKKDNIKPGESSTLLDATKRPCRILRQGAYKVKESLLT